MYSDGACSGNPGAGGWAFILRYNDIEKHCSGRDEHTTNNRMELTAVINGLKALRKQCDVVVTTDSKYVVDGINNGWAVSWRDNGWRKNNNKPALNADLWNELLLLCENHNVVFNWVKGHNGHTYNELCDNMATAAIIGRLQNSTLTNIQ